MNLNRFYDGNSDSELLKSLEGNEQINQEELSKAMNRAGLVQKQVTVHGKNGDYQAMKWVRADKKSNSSKSTNSEKKVEDSKPKKREMTLDEQIEDSWEYIAHRFNVNADDEKDVERARNDKEEYPEGELKRFEDAYKEYQELLAQKKK